MIRPLLTADCVAKSFRGRRVLSSATLRAVPGELRVLFGRNGSGKSTLLKIAAGWLAPDAGAVHFDGSVYQAVHLRAPFRGIAPRDAEDLAAVFVRLAGDGVAVVLTGHEVPTLLGTAHHISWCTSGTTYELGPPAAAIRHHAFQREYLGSWFDSRGM